MCGRTTLETYSERVCLCAWTLSAAPRRQTRVHLFKICSCKSNSLSFVLPIYAFSRVARAWSELYTVRSGRVYLYVSFPESNYSMSCVGVWLMRFWSKGCEQRCPGFGPEAETLIWEDHSYSLSLSLTPTGSALHSTPRLVSANPVVTMKAALCPCNTGLLPRGQRSMTLFHFFCTFSSC